MLHLSMLLLACQGGDTEPDDGGPVDTDSTPATGITGTTGDTATLIVDTDVGPDPDCDMAPPNGPVAWSSTPAIRTEEDFDFDGLGFLITQSSSNLAGVDRQGASHIISAGIGVDAAGMRSLPSGDIIIAQPDTGTLRRVDYATGGSVAILGGLSTPNGLVVGRDGMVYVSEWSSNGGVRMVDPYTGQFEVLMDLQFPNGITLSPDEQILYVAVATSQWSGAGRILALDRRDDGSWSTSPREVYQSDTLLDGITTDKCGNLYALEFSTGHVFRIRADNGQIDPIADLGGSNWSSARFGHGRGGWLLDELYVTNRSALYVLQVGIEGWHVLQE